MTALSLPRQRRTLPGSARRRRKAIAGYLFISPWIIGFLLFVFGPMVASLWLSFTNYSVIGSTRFVGLDNYIYMLTADRLFWSAVERTFVFATSLVVLSLIGSLGCALLLNTGLRLAPLYRAAFFIPSLTPIIAAAVVWNYILQPQFGPLNGLLAHLGIDGPGWLTSREWAVPSLVMIRLWAIVGGTEMIIFLAGLQGIPQELYDAAYVDGANRWQRFRHVTLPMLSPTIFFNLVVGIIGALKVFAIAVATTGGGPAYATHFYIVHLFEQGFVNLEMGYASALAWFFFVVVMLLTLIQFAIGQRRVHYG